MLNSLSDDIVLRILVYCTKREIIEFRQISVKFNQLIQQNVNLFKLVREGTFS